MKNRKNKICIIIFLVILLFVSTSGLLAAYVSRSYVKGVATTPKQGFVLSSDYLVVTSRSVTQDQYSKKKIMMDEKDQNDNYPYIFTFDIWNSQYGTTIGKSIIYTLKINGLPDGVNIYRDEEDITYDAIGEGAEAPRIMTFEKITHKYKIEIPKEKMITGTQFSIVAIPIDDTDYSGNMLALNVQLSVAGKVAGFSFDGFFLDKTASNYPYEFAAFNYEVVVSNAAEDHTMVLSWDPNYVEIDPFFVDKEHILDRDGKKCVELVMGPKKESNLIKFYRLRGQSNSLEEKWQQTWEELETVIQIHEK